MQGPCFYIKNFRANTITIATTTNNGTALTNMNLQRREPSARWVITVVQAVR